MLCIVRFKDLYYMLKSIWMEEHAKIVYDETAFGDEALEHGNRDRGKTAQTKRLVRKVGGIVLRDIRMNEYKPVLLEPDITNIGYIDTPEEVYQLLLP